MEGCTALASGRSAPPRSAPPPSPASSHATTTPPSSSSATPSTPTTSCSRPFLGTLVNEQVLERQRLGQDVVSDVVPPDTETLQGHRVTILNGHLDLLQMGVHRHIHSSDGAVNLGPVLHLNCHRLVGELHQEPDQLHFSELSGTLVEVNQ